MWCRRRLHRVIPNRESNVCIWAFTPTILALVSLSSYPHWASSQHQASTSKLSSTHCKDMARTVHLVGHGTRKPGISGVSSALSFWNRASLLRDLLMSLLISLNCTAQLCHQPQCLRHAHTNGCRWLMIPWWQWPWQLPSLCYSLCWPHHSAQSSAKSTERHLQAVALNKSLNFWGRSSTSLLSRIWCIKTLAAYISLHIVCLINPSITSGAICGD